ncbi:MAG: arsenate reductase (glutaredoxin) [Gammaproteobacteria bacterium]|nr:arsenate reductase (glutaredoxin) [Gammaproteobacteria bacterium]
MSVTIYHNPRCSKSRKALELLTERAPELRIVEYLKQPPDAAELDRILRLLALEPRELMRNSEAPYKELRLDDPSLDRQALIDAVCAHPILLQRPIVVANGRAVIGRPPERVLEIL